MHDVVTVRLPPALLTRLERLAVALREDPELASRGRVTRAVVLREAVARGVADLERETSSGSHHDR